MLEISTPALVFPALSVLMLAYTNKFIAISKRVRTLHSEHYSNPSGNLKKQIEVLQRRMGYIRNMQITALSGFSANILSIAAVLLRYDILALVLFVLGLALVFTSLVICIIEIYSSTQTMTLLLDEDYEDYEKKAD